MKKIPIFLLILFFSVAWASFFSVKIVKANDAGTLLDNYDAYQKYSLYLNYQKKQNYLGYLKYKKVAKYGFKNETQRASFQMAHDNYQLYLGSPVAYPQFKKLKTQYVRYENYVNKYQPLVSYAQYKNNKKLAIERSRNNFCLYVKFLFH